MSSRRTKQELGDLLGPKTLQEENLFKTLLPIAKENSIGKYRKKTQQVHLGDKEGERISAIRITVIHDAENLDTILYWNSQQVKK